MLVFSSSFNTHRVLLPACICAWSLHYRASMHWLVVFIIVIHRFKLLNSPWVPLCHVFPPFQPKVLSQREWKKNCSLVLSLFFAPVLQTALLSIWFFDLLVSIWYSLLVFANPHFAQLRALFFVCENNISLLIKLANKYPARTGTMVPFLKIQVLTFIQLSD